MPPAAAADDTAPQRGVASAKHVDAAQHLPPWIHIWRKETDSKDWVELFCRGGLLPSHGTAQDGRSKQLFLPLSPNNNLTAARRKQAPAAPCTTLSDTITSSCALRGNRKINGVNVACERFSRRRELKRKAFACGTCGGSRIEGAMCGKLIY